MRNVTRALHPSGGFFLRLVAFLFLTACVSYAYFSTPSRALGASINVTTFEDEDNTDGDCSLREAIKSAAYDTTYDACAPGSGVDVISLPAGTYPVSTQISISTELTINGSGYGSTFIDGGNSTAILHRTGAAAPLTIQFLTLTNGYTGVGSGGSCYSQGANYVTTIHSVRFSNCTTGGRGGAIYNAGTMTIEDSILTTNSAASVATNNNSGGAIYMTGGNLSIIRTSFVDNSADPSASDGRGGAIHNGSTGGEISIVDSSFTGNEGRVGGAIMSFGTITIQNSTFFQNSAGSGGALYIGSSGSVLYLENSTFANNNEGAINNAGNASIRSSTFSGNTTDPTLINTGSLSFKNSILHKADGDNCVSSMTSEGFNIENTDSCGLSASGDQVNTDALLGLLDWNGGHTRTIELLSGSPAIDAGDPSGCTGSLGGALLVDQRGFPRPVDGDLDGNARCDIGAYERELSLQYLPLILK